MVPHILEISATKETGVSSVIKTSKPGQPDPVPSEKKFNRTSLSKGKKGARKYSQLYFDSKYIWLKNLWHGIREWDGGQAENLQPRA